jgi:excisionase family DNA binding protein
MPAPRFLTLTDVAEVLNTSSAQVYALVRRKELKAIKIGGRGQWRVEDSELEAFRYAGDGAPGRWLHKVV